MATKCSEHFVRRVAQREVHGSLGCVSVCVRVPVQSVVMKLTVTGHLHLAHPVESIIALYYTNGGKINRLLLLINKEI